MSKIRLILVGLLLACAIDAALAASASAALIWLECKNVGAGNGFHANPLCNDPPQAGGTYAWVAIPRGVRLKTKSSGVPFTLKGTLAGVKITTECKKEQDEGWLENPAGTGNGTDLESTTFTECTVAPTGQECKVKEPIKSLTNTALISVDIKVEDHFTPEGAHFEEITFEGCKTSALNGTFPVNGGAYGVIPTESSLLQFSGETSELTFGGNPARLSGTNTQETTEGAGLSAE
jgi:hypothetical protein